MALRSVQCCISPLSHLLSSTHLLFLNSENLFSGLSMNVTCSVSSSFLVLRHLSCFVVEESPSCCIAVLLISFSLFITACLSCQSCRSPSSVEGSSLCPSEVCMSYFRICPALVMIAGFLEVADFTTPPLFGHHLG